MASRNKEKELILGMHQIYSMWKKVRWAKNGLLFKMIFESGFKITVIFVRH